MAEQYITESEFQWVIGTIVLIWLAVTGALYGMLNARGRIGRREVIEMVTASEERVNERMNEQRDSLIQIRKDVQSMGQNLNNGQERIMSILLGNRRR